MNENQFRALSADLRVLAANIPLHWGKVQNNRSDSLLRMFEIPSYEELEEAIARFSDNDKNYWRRRWYIWQCSRCDEYLFYCNENTIQNPESRDKEWDVRITGEQRTIDFDIKGTVIPKDMRDHVEGIIECPFEMVDWFYDHQSKGVRFDIQNRLFIVHHSFVEPEREFYLRCAWRSKREIYREFVTNIDRINFIDTHHVQAGVIFILEREKNVVSHKIVGL